MSRKFHITDILSITTGRLVSTRQMNGVFDILEYMTGQDIYTHQIPRARTICASILLEQYPHLTASDCRGVDETNIAARTEKWISRFGEFLTVRKMNSKLHDFSDPVVDLAENIHPDRIFPISTDRFHQSQPK